MPIHQGTAFNRLFRIVFFRCFAPIVVTAHQTAADICGFFRPHKHCCLATDRPTYKPSLIRLQPSDILSKPNKLSLMRKFLSHSPHNNWVVYSLWGSRINYYCCSFFFVTNASKSKSLTTDSWSLRDFCPRNSLNLTLQENKKIELPFVVFKWVFPRIS